MVIVVIVSTTVIVIVVAAVLQRLTINTSINNDGGNSRINHTDINKYGTIRSNDTIASITMSNVTQSIPNHE